eukprot:3217429-Alexandrium_andersonii.AAC.1
MMPRASLQGRESGRLAPATHLAPTIQHEVWDRTARTLARSTATGRGPPEPPFPALGGGDE